MQFLFGLDEELPAVMAVSQLQANEELIYLSDCKLQPGPDASSELPMYFTWASSGRIPRCI